MKPLCRIKSLTTAVIAVALSGPASADWKIVSKLNVEGLLDRAGLRAAHSQDVTTYIKGERVAVVVEGGPVTLYDVPSGKVYVLNPTEKTYSVQTLKQRAGEGGPVGRMADHLKVDTKVDADKKDETRTMAGRAAQRYEISGRMTMSFNMGNPGGGMGGGPMGGGPMGGGRRPGRVDPGWPSGQGSPGAMKMPAVEFSGEMWVTASPATTKSKNKLASLPFAAAILPSSPMLAPLAERLNKTKGIPLSSRVTVTITSPDDDYPTRITQTQEVTAISDVTLEEAVFQLPQGFRRVEPATAQPLIAPPTGLVPPTDRR